MLFRPDFSTLVNWGIVAVTLGQEEEGIERLEKGVELEPTDPQARLYLGDAYLMRADYENASTQFAAYLDITGPTAMDSPENIAENIAAAMKMGDALAGMGKTQESLFWFQRVVENSLKLRQFELASQAFARAGEVQEQSGFLHEAAGLFRSGISVAEDSGYEEPQGRAWYHYAKFLRRQRAKDELVLAASLRCETMLRATLSDSLDSATVLRREVERVLGEEGSTLVRGDLDKLLRSGSPVGAWNRYRERSFSASLRRRRAMRRFALILDGLAATVRPQQQAMIRLGCEARARFVDRIREDKIEALLAQLLFGVCGQAV
jgi:tetratricopeptide (TPR) repeat protein